MKKYLFYAMEGKKMCFLHVLMNALDLDEKGHQVHIVLEGEACKMPQVLREENNPLYLKAIEKGLIKGACHACSQMLGVLSFNEKEPFQMLADMKGHAGMKPFIDAGYEIIAM